MTSRTDTVPANAEHFPAENFLNRELGLLAFNRRVLSQARNPRTGEAISVPSMKVPKFRAAKALKEAVK